MMHGIVVTVLVAVLSGSIAMVCQPRSARAHAMAPAVLGLAEASPGKFAIRWTPSVDAYGIQEPMEPRFPNHCVREGGQVLCEDSGLTRIHFDRRAEQRSTILVQVRWRSGVTERFVVSSTQTEIVLTRSARSAGVAWEYGRLGTEHIFGGLDHLAFVLGLVLVTGLSRSLLAAVTGFTVAHALTLVLSVLGLVRLPSGPVEAVIALSVIWVSREAYLLARVGRKVARSSWFVASAFGLLHGFGFAGALREIGLPPDNIPLALASFNAGVEVGQLMFIGGLWLAVHGCPVAILRLAWFHRVAAGVMGSIASYWMLERVVALW